MFIIETQNLTKHYGQARGIESLTLRVAPGEFFGFIGPNGAGKSTTIRTLLGLILPSSGTAQVLGLPVRQAVRFLNQVGYMPSEAMFYNGMRVREIIAYSAKLRRADCAKEAGALCDALDVDTNKRIEELSLGNRKKLSIVCALQHRPPLYILDEPTSGLDPLVQKTFFALLKERVNEGATVFLSSHVLSEVQHHCTRAAIIRDGRIVRVDKMENLSQRHAKRVTLHGLTALPDGLAVQDCKITDHAVSFLYAGDVPALIAKLQGLPIIDMTMTEPDLEEIFLHYYQKEEA